MINTFWLKKWSAILVQGLVPTVVFFILLQFYNFLYAIIGLLIAVLVFGLLAALLLKNPFSMMLEGKGIMVVNLDSTGIIGFSIVGLQSPYIKGKFKGKEIKDVWDRETVAQIAPPVKNTIKAEKIMEGKKKGGLRIEIDEKEYNDSRFALFHWPVLIWNDQIKSLITKKWLSDAEKETFAEHGILYLNRKMEELSGYMRDFARHVVESTKPKANIFQNKWFWIIIIGLIIMIILLFLPGLIKSLGEVWKGMGGTVGNVMPSSPVTPR